MLKSVLQFLIGLTIFFTAMHYLTSSGGEDNGSHREASTQPKTQTPEQFLTCSLPTRPVITANISKDQLRLREIKLIQKEKGLDNIQEAKFFYKYYEEELRNFPENLNDFKSRFDVTKRMNLEPNEKERLLSMHKENYDATCANYSQALAAKYARLLKLQTIRK